VAVLLPSDSLSKMTKQVVFFKLRIPGLKGEIGGVVITHTSAYEEDYKEEVPLGNHILIQTKPDKRRRKHRKTFRFMEFPPSTPFVSFF